MEMVVKVIKITTIKCKKICIYAEKIQIFPYKFVDCQGEITKDAAFAFPEETKREIFIQVTS